MQFLARNSSSSATARAAPSSGAVPVPISSTSTREFGVAASSMVFKFSMWAEKVDKSAAIDCSSPMSTRTRSKSGSTACCAATGIPDCAASAAIPVVFSATVLPPVFGPLMTSTRSSPPRVSVMGTMARFSLRSLSSSTGWRAPSKRNSFVAENSGIAASNSPANRARANTLSSSAMVPAAVRSGPRIICNFSVSSRKIRRISAASSSASCTSWLLASTVSNGSRKTVCPVALAPCTTPGMLLRCSARTGITKRSFRSVT